jgi:serine/threonine-protein kinase RsbW
MDQVKSVSDMRMKLALTLPSQADSVAVARQALGRILTALGVRTDCRQDIELAVSEACSNAVQHALSQPSYEITAEVDRSQCVITVSNHGPTDLPTDTTMPAATAQAGRGLAFMQATMDGVQLQSHPQGSLSVRLVKQLSWNAGALGSLPRMQPDP